MHLLEKLNTASSRWLRRNHDALVAAGLLILGAVVVPPSANVRQLLLDLVVAVAVTLLVLLAVRRSVAKLGLWAQGPWVRATLALGASASIVMIVGATAAVLG
jgi:hypothetical protein